MHAAAGDAADPGDLKADTTAGDGSAQQAPQPPRGPRVVSGEEGQVGSVLGGGIADGATPLPVPVRSQLMPTYQLGSFGPGASYSWLGSSSREHSLASNAMTAARTHSTLKPSGLRCDECEGAGGSAERDVLRQPAERNQPSASTRMGSGSSSRPCSPAPAALVTTAGALAATKGTASLPSSPTPPRLVHVPLPCGSLRRRSQLLAATHPAGSSSSSPVSAGGSRSCGGAHIAAAAAAVAVVAEPHSSGLPQGNVERPPPLTRHESAGYTFGQHAEGHVVLEGVVPASCDNTPHISAAAGASGVCSPTRTAGSNVASSIPVMQGDELPGGWEGRVPSEDAAACGGAHSDPHDSEEPEPGLVEQVLDEMLSHV
jgi:hypothetical protein